MSKYLENKLVGGYDPNDPTNELPFSDTIILPRDKKPDKKRHLALLTRLGAKPVPEEDFPKDAAKSWMSIQRNMSLPGSGDPKAPTVRDEAEKLLKNRDIVIYINQKHNDSVRIAVFPAITNAEVYDVFVRAGYPDIKKPKHPSKAAINNVTALTETTKMGCYSWNLPAGPAKLGGTCPASGLGFMYSTRNELERTQSALRDPETVIRPLSFICNGCYALKAAYGNPSNIFFMALKMIVTQRLLRIEAARERGSDKREPRFHFASAEVFDAAEKKFGNKRLTSEVLGLAYADGMLSPVDFGFDHFMRMAIERSRARVRVRRAKLKHFGYTAIEYEATERNVNLVEVRDEAIKLMDVVEDETTKPAMRKKAQDNLATLFKNTRLTEADILAPVGKGKRKRDVWELPDPDYFRIHDAGDFFNDSYFNSWMKVCSSLPDVWFWAPTRVWAFRGSLSDGTRRDEDALSMVPKNLALRPSTLHFRDEAPTAAYLDSLGLPKYQPSIGNGLSAASGSAPKIPTATDWKCPAYEHWSKKGGAIRLDSKTGKPVGGTCATARGPNGEEGCRACWRYNDTVVFYSEH